MLGFTDQSTPKIGTCLNVGNKYWLINGELINVDGINSFDIKTKIS